MYFPYLRGKQYELIAVRELAPLLAAQARTIPIIEPVRAAGSSSLSRFTDILDSAGLPFVLIVNPTVGELASIDPNPDIVEFIRSKDEAELWNVGVIVEDGTDWPALVQRLQRAVGFRSIAFIHRSVPPRGVDLVELTASLNRAYEVIDDRWRSRPFRALLDGARGVTLRDGFMPAARNSDYLARAETVFTEDHLYFREETWFGFSDFLTVGEPFTEGGFTPRAVAIHWTFERPHGGEVWIRHFTSESNNVIGDVGGKFLEAAAKLIRFLDEHAIVDTGAAVVMRQHLTAETFPGLGVVKKLSIQNHLELMSEILSRQ